MAIITSLLDTDLYKLTMGQVVFHKFSSAIVEYKFKLRNSGVSLVPFKEEIEEEIDALCRLRFREEELEYLRKLPFFTSDYIELLRIMQLSRDFITVSVENGELNIRIKGPWFITIYFEVPVLAIVNEVYYRHIDEGYGVIKDGKFPTTALFNLFNKINLTKSTEIKFADFGTRRRFSKLLQNRIVEILKQKVPSNFIGTSNVMLAMKHDVKPIGTMAHEFIQACQAFTSIRESQKYALQIWADEYKGKLAIALSDTVGFDAFLKDFGFHFATLYEGVRQDSGDPFDVARKLIKHYEELKLDPKEHKIVFSDGLTFPLALELQKEFADKINVSFGIGTNLTNDCGFEPLQIVIKMVKCNGQDVAKVSNSEGKEMCENIKYMNLVKEVFEIK